MAPIKFEENIREKLEERELRPSENAWERLNAQLDRTTKKKSNKAVWYAIAASFIGAIIAASIFFNSSALPLEETKELVQEDVKPPKTPSEVIEEIKFADPSEAITNTTTQSTKETLSVEKQKANLPIKRNVINSVENVNNNLKKIANSAVITTKIEERPIVSQSHLTQEEIVFNTKVNEVVAQVKMLQSNNPEVTAKEIDALLKTAHREIQTQRILSEKRVDATALLLDVESELERSFRDKVFDALGEGFQVIRTAVVERNN